MDVECMLDDKLDSYELSNVNNEIIFNATTSLDKELDADYNALSDYDDSYDVVISANYNYDTYIMYLSYYIYDEDELVEYDTLMGCPCLNDDGSIDVAFYDDGDILYLSELDITSAVDNCSLFSKLRSFASKCTKSLTYVAPVCTTIAVVAGAVAVSCVTCGTGGVAILETYFAASTITAAAVAVASVPLVIGGIAIKAEIVGYLGENILSMTQAQKASIKTIDDLLDMDDIKDKIKDFGITREKVWRYY